jgi:DNA-binding transcriptional regulator YdaS (Cro superfamily)
VHAEGKSRAPHASITACAAATAVTTSICAAPVAAVIATPVPPSANPATPTTGPAALLRAIALRGSQSALASAIGVSQSHVWHWLARLRVPAEHCPAIERATQRAVRCEELRPDIDWGYLRALCEPVQGTVHETAHQPSNHPPREASPRPKEATPQTV